jgi:hypothetical protein
MWLLRRKFGIQKMSRLGCANHATVVYPLSGSIGTRSRRTTSTRRYERWQRRRSWKASWSIRSYRLRREGKCARARYHLIHAWLNSARFAAARASGRMDVGRTKQEIALHGAGVSAREGKRLGMYNYLCLAKQIMRAVQYTKHDGYIPRISCVFVQGEPS